MHSSVNMSVRRIWILGNLIEVIFNFLDICKGHHTICNATVSKIKWIYLTMYAEYGYLADLMYTIFKI